MIGTTLGHYRIVEQVGAGGVGVVYLARDERLERDVAIKVLSPRQALTRAARRSFRREALALSRANHPNIATIHDFDSQDGLDYIVIGSRAAAARSRGTRFRRKILTQRMVLDGRAEVVIRLARQHVKRAERRATAMGLRPAVEYASQMREYCEAVGDASHRARVDLLFAPLRLVSGRQRSAN